MTYSSQYEATPFSRKPPREPPLPGTDWPCRAGRGTDIDTDELLASLTPRDENSVIKTYQNTVSVACPACEERSDDIVVWQGEPDRSKQLDLCVGVDSERAFIFTHKP